LSRGQNREALILQGIFEPTTSLHLACLDSAVARFGETKFEERERHYYTLALNVVHNNISSS